MLAGKYRLVRELGRGGMGAVWCAEHLALGAPRALELIEGTASDRPEGARQFQHEARMAAGLQLAAWSGHTRRTSFTET